MMNSEDDKNEACDLVRRALRERLEWLGHMAHANHSKGDV